jgi:hypothetical protein
MVLNREVKPDVFAGFEIDLEVRDNNETKMQELVDLQTRGPTQFVGGKAAPKEDVFAPFKIDDKEQKLHSTDEEKAKAAAAAAAAAGPLGKNSRHGSGGNKVVRRQSSTLGRRKSNLDNGMQSERTPVRSERLVNNNVRWQSERFDTGGGDQKQTLRRMNSSRLFSEQKNNNGSGDDKIVAPGKRLRMASVRQTSNLQALVEEDITFDDDDLVTQVTVSEDTRDRVAYETQSTRLTSAGSDAAAAAETGIPQGVVPLTAGEELMDDIFRLEKPEYDIFADFDLDAIVRDYETMQRKMNHAPGKDKGEEDKVSDEAENYAGMYRYRNMKQMWLDNFPRLHGIIFRIMVPLWILVAVSLLLGYYLAGFEEESEYQANDSVMASRFRFHQLPYDETLKFLLVLPTACFELYTHLKINQTGATVPPSAIELNYWFGENFPEIPPLNSSADVDVEEIAAEIAGFLVACESIATEQVVNQLNYTDTEAAFEAATGSALSFDWVRCWDTELYGMYCS